jgi:hypothetical protein
MNTNWYERLNMLANKSPVNRIFLYDVANRILALERAVQWISINDALPSSNTMILLFAPTNYHVSNGGITYGFYDSYANKWFHNGSGMRRQYDEVDDQMHPKRTEQLNTAVTHWMALPDKPGELA